jgi:hypothetical protein
MPSLTLTDPDMILPYGSERQSQTPSPPSQLVYLSNLNARYNSADPHAVSSGSSARPKKNFSRSAWTHEDLSTSASRRLSDIGEELSPARSVGFDEQDEQGQYQGQYQSQGQGQAQGQYTGYTGAETQGLTSWPGLPDSNENENENDNASSSSSTVSAGSRHARDVSKSHESISSQGNGQSQSLAQAQAQAHAVQEREPDLVQGASNEIKGIPDKNTIASAVKGKGPGDEFSSAILSSEAERILDNAKKRLTVRELDSHSRGLIH